MTPLQAIKLVLALLVGAGLFFGTTTVLGWREAALKNAETVRQLDGTATATSAIASAASEAQTNQRADEAVVTSARTTYRHQLEAATREDISLADWRAQPVPQRMRDLARARRCARDGLGSDAAGCRGANPAPGAGR